MRLYNSLTRQVEEFAPVDGRTVRMYVCGVTPYDTTHMGHAMTYLTFDVINRYCQSRGWRVKYVQNVTDIDDDILRKAREVGEAWDRLGDRHILQLQEDLNALNALPPAVYPRASEEIPMIIEMVSGLVASGHAYEREGNVYFRVASDPDYGQLSGLDPETMRALSAERGADPNDPRKENPLDFILWQAAQPGEPAWDSPWGPGRPGWHIECSAMCLHHLGETIDIHGGGNDLIFPHHENEIAQSESLTGKPLARYWMHNGMLQFGGEKMSKSLGNLVTIDDFLSKHSPDVLRMLIFTGHYRKPIVFNDETLAGAERALSRLRSGLRPSTGGKTTGPEADSLRQAAENARAAFIAAMNADFNTSSALAALFELVRAINTGRDAGVGGPFYQAAQRTLQQLAGVLGLALSEPAAENGNELAARPFVDLLVQVRADLRAAKQWALADKVRDGLKELGVALEDGPDGTQWRYQEQ
mgnify:CR=1 FL=1